MRRSGEGPQLKLELCEWMEKMHVECGGGDEAWEAVLQAASEEWCKGVAVMRRIYDEKDRWKSECAARGVNAHGLTRDEAHLPRYLRKSRRSKGKVVRASGGGMKDFFQFLYAPVRDFFEEMRLHGKYCDGVDLEEHLMLTMQRYLTEAEKKGLGARAQPQSSASST